MDGILNAILSELGGRDVTALIIGVLILVWLYFDIKRQKRWREEKEDKIARTKARIARKNAQKDAD